VRQILPSFARKSDSLALSTECEKAMDLVRVFMNDWPRKIHFPETIQADTMWLHSRAWWPYRIPFSKHDIGYDKLIVPDQYSFDSNQRNTTRRANILKGWENNEGENENIKNSELNREERVGQQ
jgi:hypothetical protein